MNFFIGMFLQVLNLPRTTVVKTEDLEERLLSTFLIFHFQSLGNMTQFLFKSGVGNKS